MDIKPPKGFNEISGNKSDTCDINEIIDCFWSCPHVHVQSVGPKYILNLSATRESNPHIAATLSDYSIDICKLHDNGISKIVQFQKHTKKVIDCKFSEQNNNLLYSGSNDGTIKLWDLRESDSVVTFSDTTLDGSDPIKWFSSFDVCPNNRLLAAGTDLTGGDAYILFWDIRNSKLLGSYWESHTDNITQVKFHPEDSNKLMSGSTDGLINIYDLSQTSEDNAFEYCLNTNSFVENLLWFKENDKTKISCITSTNELQLWGLDDAEPYKHLSRDEVGKVIKKKKRNVYLVNVHQVKDSLCVIAGSNHSLRSFQVSSEKINPAFRFDNHIQQVRASWLDENTLKRLRNTKKRSTPNH